MFRKFLLPLLAVVGVVFAIYTVVTGSQEPAVSQPIAPPAQAPFEAYVAGAGLVEASTENIAVGTPVAGVVSEMKVKVGDDVKRGDPLFLIDLRDLQAELLVREADLKTRQANVEVAQATAADARNQFELYQAIGDVRAVTKEELDRRRFATDIAEASVAQAQAQVSAADASIAQLKVELDRRIVRAPVDGQVLQVKVRAGEFAPAGVLATPLMLIGDVRTLHVRVDVDENDAWRVDPRARATASVRGNSQLKTDLQFVRIEPYVVPKRSLTGESSERVDTRVLQVLYSFDRNALRNIYVGQQMDVFIEDLISPRDNTSRPVVKTD
ncbi:MAG TPA: HlyD family efflux transporter periplasmic adaptor subunit [Tepidisphaeraceae bacterium]|jgi:RND family efflux transporter MFP subunit|nr:HlyD family efflux transporter periplasmic adaptor subunit [Tepidisphaeraceae bacterium]